MNVNTLFNRSERAALHVPVVLVLLAGVLIMLTVHAHAASSANAKGQINGSAGVNLRSGSSTSSAIVDVLADNTELIIYREVYKSKKSTSSAKRWYYVEADGRTGYVRADCVDNIRYTEVSARITKKVSYRKGPGTKMKKKGVFKAGKKVTVCLDARPVKSARGSSKKWYRVRVGSGYGFVPSSSVKITSVKTEGKVTATAAPAVTSEDKVSQVVKITTNAFSKMTAEQFEKYLTKQGFPESYKKRLRVLRARHPNWVFVAYKTGLKWKDVLKKQTARNVSLIYRSYPKSYRSKSYKRQVEPGWYNANKKVVAYYMDPRNFLNEDRIYMFENLGYQSEYQTAGVVKKIIGSTKLPGYGFTHTVFMKAGKKHNISPVFLAARVLQETGGKSISVNGSKSGGKVVYNPFNIGAYGRNPASRGLAYAKKMGWTTPSKAVNGGAKYLARGYISKRQNTIYFQRFNVANGLSKAGTHQYMTNIMAPYSESHITKSSYTKMGISNEPLGFIIPVYKSMPSKTKLP